MEDKEIEIQVNLTSDDQKRCLLWYDRVKITCLKIIVGFFAIFILVGGVAFSLDSDDSTSVIMLIPILIPFALFSFLLFSIFRNINKQAEIVELNSEEIKYTYRDNGFEVNSNSSRLETSWNKIHKIIENKTDFLFFPQENIFFPIPKICSENENQIEKLRNLIGSNLGANAKLIN